MGTKTELSLTHFLSGVAVYCSTHSQEVKREFGWVNRGGAKASPKTNSKPNDIECKLGEADLFIAFSVSEGLCRGSPRLDVRYTFEAGNGWSRNNKNCALEPQNSSTGFTIGLKSIL